MEKLRHSFQMTSDLFKTQPQASFYYIVQRGEKLIY